MKKDLQESLASPKSKVKQRATRIATVLCTSALVLFKIFIKFSKKGEMKATYQACEPSNPPILACFPVQSCLIMLMT